MELKRWRDRHAPRIQASLPTMDTVDGLFQVVTNADDTLTILARADGENWSITFDHDEVLELREHCSRNASGRTG